jgi:hypothetical protein
MALSIDTVTLTLWAWLRDTTANKITDNSRFICTKIRLSGKTKDKGKDKDGIYKGIISAKIAFTNRTKYMTIFRKL